MSEIRAVLFDADGVLIRPDELYSLKYARETGLEQERLNDFFQGPFLDCLCGKGDLKQAIEPFLSAWGWQSDVQTYLDEWFRWEHRLEERLIESVAGLRKAGVPCYLATNQEQYRLQYMLANMGFESMFDGVFCSCRLGVRKPDVDYFRCAWEQMDRVQPGEALFWDDRQENVEAARSFGLQAELYTDYADFSAKMERYLP